MSVKKAKDQYLSGSHPDLALEFDRIKNFPRCPESTRPSEHDSLYWLCRKCAHSWRTACNNRTKTKAAGCPVCSGRCVHSDGRNTMEKTHPELALSFDLSKNAPLTPRDVKAGTALKLWWICPICTHSWSATGNSRSYGVGCPSCSGMSIHSSGRDSLSERRPEIAAEFDAKKNFPLSSQDILPGSSKRVWWRCGTCRNSWRATCSSRTRQDGTGCPDCGRQNAAEYIAVSYLSQILSETATLLSQGDSSKLQNPEGGHPFQIDALLEIAGNRVAYLYDGCGGHWDTEESRAIDARRRKALCKSGLVSAVYTHRHGMDGITEAVAETNYFEAAVSRDTSIFRGVQQLADLIHVPKKTVAPSEVLARAEASWGKTPGRNKMLFNNAVKKEVRLLRLEAT